MSIALLVCQDPETKIGGGEGAAFQLDECVVPYF